jgi:hypothetical protein
MKLKFLLITLLSITLVLCVNTILMSYQTGSPAGYTGAPQDGVTCAVSGCHTSKLDDTTNGSRLTVQLLNNQSPVVNYAPGKSYTLKIRLRRAGCVKMGFETTAFKGTKFVHAGSFIIGSNSNINFTPSNNDYVTHSFSGTAITDTVADATVWTVDWTAPPAGTGTVNFYTSGNATNDDATVLGDHIYTNKLAINESTSGIEEANNPFENIHIYPNPAHDNISVSYTLSEVSNTGIEVTDLNGRQVQRLFYGKQQPGEHTFSAKLDDMPAGMYFLRISSVHGAVYRKLSIR